MALLINSKLWSTLGSQFSPRGAPITFKSEQTPLIYDPLSTVLFGSASCTGISITYVDALRSAGIPARLVGTPAWHGKVEDGNHNWVEVWLGNQIGWKFIEGAPAGAGETFENPCSMWFCNPSHFNKSGTQVFAATYGESGPGSIHYPMAWDLDNTGVVGVDRSAYYNAVCSAC